MVCQCLRGSMGVQGHRRRANGTSRYKLRVAHEERIHPLYQTTTTPQAPGYFSTVLSEYMQGPVMLMGLPLDGWEATQSIPGEADIGKNMGNGTRPGRGPNIEEGG